MFQSLKNLQIFWQFARFGVIGVCAACTHVCVVLLLTQMSIALAVANIAGFLVAFWVSYFGHLYFTFGHQASRSKRTLIKFMLVACSGFLVNESLVVLLQHISHLSNSSIVISAILFTSIISFVFNRYFAFHPQG